MDLRPDVAVVGAGITGLLLTQKLAGLGISVVLIERENTLASGPSTRNEGWLHRGTYHAFSIQDRRTAVDVARRCIYGHEQIKSMVPEAVESTDNSTFAILKNTDCQAELIERWNAAGVRYRRVKNGVLQGLDPNIIIPKAASVYEVQDVSVDTRIVYRKLLHQALVGKARVLTSSEVCGGSRTHWEVVGDNRFNVEPKVFVYATGFYTGELFWKLYGVSLPIRLWKSHLIILPRFARNSFFYLDPGEAAVMHHGAASIVGLNEDARECGELSHNPDPDGIENIMRALKRLTKDKLNRVVPIACTKVDVTTRAESIPAKRSLNTFFKEELPGHIWILPGKMTEAPFVVDQVVQELCNRLPDARISSRPCDSLAPFPF